MTLTTDMGKILTNLHSVRAKGKIDFLSGLQVAGVSEREKKTRENK